MSGKNRVIAIALIVLLVWVGMFTADWFAVSAFDRKPIFCISIGDKYHYTGLGYSYDAYRNFVGGQFEYCLYIFGSPVTSTFTD